MQRLVGVDPLAADYAAYCDYAYVVGNPIIFIDQDGRNTIYYDEEGNEIGRSQDDLDNAVVVISNDNLELFKANSEKIYKDKEGKNSADLKANDLRGLGMNYMIAGMINLLDISLSNPAKKEGYRMKDGSDMYSEYVAELIISGNTVQIDMRTSKTHRYPDGIILPTQDPSAHSHPNGYIKEGVEETNDEWESFKDADHFGGSEGAPPSRVDQSNRSGKKTNIRDIVVSPTTIWLYNGNSSSNIAAPINFFLNEKNK